MDQLRSVEIHTEEVHGDPPTWIARGEFEPGHQLVGRGATEGEAIRALFKTAFPKMESIKLATQAAWDPTVERVRDALDKPKTD